MDILKTTRRAHHESDFLWFCPAVSQSGLGWDGNVGLKSILCISPMLKVRKVGRVTADNVRGGRSWLLSFYIPCIHSKNAYCKLYNWQFWLSIVEMGRKECLIPQWCQSFFSLAFNDGNDLVNHLYNMACGLVPMTKSQRCHYPMMMHSHSCPIA